MAATQPKSSAMLVTAAVMLAAALSLLGSVQYWSAESEYQRQSPDPYRIADQATRLADFRSAVPADAILGYLTDVPADNTLNASMFFAAQYQLAPRLLQKDEAHDLVLGNFTRPADFVALGRQYGLRIERDFGNGILLFRREAKQ
jgi:hypothetical protein